MRGSHRVEDDDQRAARHAGRSEQRIDQTE
jgi:hypothetical protein